MRPPLRLFEPISQVAKLLFQQCREEAANCNEDDVPVARRPGMEFPAKVKRWLEADIADIASRPQECAVRPGVDFTRTRKIGLASHMRMLVTMGTGSLSHELMEASGYDPEEEHAAVLPLRKSVN